MVIITLSTRKYIDTMTRLVDAQLPYAISRALNSLALEIQTGERAGIHKSFIVRRSEYIDRTVKIPRFSDKGDASLSVKVGIDPARDQLVKFEEGGRKVPRTGGHAIAVPIDARASPYAIVPNSLRPKALQLTETMTAKGKRRTLGKLNTFLVTLPSGKQGIYQRIGPGPEGVRLLYWLTPSVPIRPQLNFVRTARTVIDARWPLLFRKWLYVALDTAR